jgi:hypothetical protein
MKKPTNEFTRMQKLAGLNEIKINKPASRLSSILKIYHYDPSSYKLMDVDAQPYPSEQEAKKAALAYNWEIAWENMDTDLSKEDYISTHTWEDLLNGDIGYDNYEFEII